MELEALKYKDEIDFANNDVKSAKILTLKKDQSSYNEFFELVTAVPPTFDKAKEFLEKLYWTPI